MNCPVCPGGKAGTFGKPRVLPDGSILFRKKGWEPPPDIDGFVRDSKDLWRFIPLMPPCVLRIQMQRLKKCGKLEMLVVCNHPDGPLKQCNVTPEICNACPLRKATV